MAPNKKVTAKQSIEVLEPITERELRMLRIGIGLGIDHQCSNSIHYHKNLDDLVKYYTENPWAHKTLKPIQ